MGGGGWWWLSQGSVHLFVQGKTRLHPTSGQGRRGGRFRDGPRGAVAPLPHADSRKKEKEKPLSIGVEAYSLRGKQLDVPELGFGTWLSLKVPLPGQHTSRQAALPPPFSALSSWCWPCFHQPSRGLSFQPEPLGLGPLHNWYSFPQRAPRGRETHTLH